MILRPGSFEELAEAVKGASGKISSIDFSSFSKTIIHSPEDLIATVPAGLCLAEVQVLLGKQGQYLPVDPPRADRLYISDLLAFDLSGPSRFGFGTVREHVIGLRAVLGDGRVIQTGGKVVKNVAGYDLARLMIGARHRLGIIGEATFKLHPIPQRRILLQKTCRSWDEAEVMLEVLWNSELTPAILDLHTLRGVPVLVVGFSGTSEEVGWLEKKAEEAGFAEKGDASYADFQPDPWDPEGRKASFLPSQFISEARKLNCPLVARAGNGVLYYKGGPARPLEEAPEMLLKRLHAAYDPRGLFEEITP